MNGGNDDDVLIGTGVSQDEIRELNAPEEGKPKNEPGDGEQGEPKPKPGTDDVVLEEDLLEHDEGGDARTTVDQELEDAADDEAREAIRERRRQDRKDRKARAKERFSSLESKLEATLKLNAELAAQVASIANANSHSQMTQLDAGIQQASNAVAHFEGIIADAVTKGDGKTVVEATRLANDARNRANELTNYKTAMVNNSRAPKTLDPNMVKHARSFMEKNKWFGGNESKDPDSRVLSALDNSLAAEGWDPTTPAYWQELENRGKKYLPHRFSEPADSGGGYNAPTGGEQQRQNKSPVAGQGDRNSGKVANSNTVAISSERVKAMKEAGLWDDPKVRARTIANYRAYDANAKNRNS